MAVSIPTREDWKTPVKRLAALTDLGWLCFLPRRPSKRAG